ncbi:MAG TPA: hypothetical protein VI299_24265, partial [Polyangiales bacterium]
MIWKRVVALSLMMVACGDDEAAATRDDGAVGKGSYDLCDGSDDLRLSLVSGGGGPVPDDYAFSYAYGWRFLHVDGHCNFVTQGAQKGKVLTGTFSAQQGKALSETLGLARTSGVTYRFQGGCPDAPSSVVTTHDATLISGCGDEPPPQIAAAFAWDTTFALANSVGTPAAGAVSIVALPYDAVLNSAILWTFAWPIDEIVAPEGSYRDVPTYAKTLTGSDAATARELWNNFIASQTLHDGLPMISNGKTYKVFFRDELDASWAGKIAALQEGAKIAACDAARVLKAGPLDAGLYEHSVVATLPTSAPCGTDLCWDGTFDESDPVQTHLRLQTPPTTRTCLGTRALEVSADLQPLIDAFRASYPRTPVEIDLGFGTLRDDRGDDAICRALTIESCASDPRCRSITGSLNDPGHG